MATSDFLVRMTFNGSTFSLIAVPNPNFPSSLIEVVPLSERPEGRPGFLPGLIVESGSLDPTGLVPGDSTLPGLSFPS